MLKLKQYAGILLMLFIATSVVWGEAIPPKRGTVYTYASGNSRYVLSVKILGYPDAGPSEISLREDGKEMWSRIIDATPSRVAIADDGSRIAMTNWGWYDEGGSRSLSIYDRQGELIKEVPFGAPGWGGEGMKWVRALAIASDGSYCLVGQSGKEQAYFTLYDCRKGEMVWEKEYGLPEAREARLAAEGRYLLIATDEYYSQDMHFLLLNRDGTVLTQKKLAKNYSWDVRQYLRFRENGSEFEIFDLKSGKFIVVPF